MRRDEVIRQLKTIEPDARRMGVGALYLFGSHARDEARPDSDVDVFVDPERDEFYRLRNFMGVYDVLCEVLPSVKVDYGTRRGLSPYIVPYVTQDAIRVF